jgi:hypothetical protein
LKPLVVLSAPEVPVWRVRAGWMANRPQDRAVGRTGLPCENDKGAGSRPVLPHPAARAAVRVNRVRRADVRLPADDRRAGGWLSWPWRWRGFSPE